MKSIRTTGLLIALTSLAACATVAAPNELVTARTAYDRASTGPAAALDPTDLHTAKESLNTAEASFEKDGATQETKDLAYAAERTTETAESHARTIQAMQARDQVLAQMHAAQTTEVQVTSAELGVANRQLAAQGQALASEKQGRQDAEKRAALATADLARFATVKQESRGTVITLSGSVLFASAQWDLLPSAQLKLTDVGNALTKQDPDSKIVVEGYTDSQGGVAFNQDLSQKRADSVRTYLVSRGIASDRITAQGFGAARSIADNGSAEGRANNRRVEIVIQPTTP
jgi:outer membrane protein OmpA-like peptidoglycan-associated protein